MYEIPVYRVALVKEPSLDMQMGRYTSPESLALVLSRYFEGADREQLAVVMLNGRNRIIGISTASIGTLNQALASPREVFKPAILCNAAAVILSHNHPSGDPQPSHEDRAMTNRMEEAGALLGISVLDHIIMGEDADYFSFAMEKKGKEEEKDEKETARRIERARRKMENGKASAEDIVDWAAFKMENIFSIKRSERRPEVENIVQVLTPLVEAKGTRMSIRERAEVLREKAKMHMRVLIEDDPSEVSA